MQDVVDDTVTQNIPVETVHWPDTALLLEVIAETNIETLKAQIQAALPDPQQADAAPQSKSQLLKKCLKSAGADDHATSSIESDDRFVQYEQRFGQALYQLKRDGLISNPAWGQYSLAENDADAIIAPVTGRGIGTMTETKKFVLSFIDDQAQDENGGVYWRDVYLAYAEDRGFSPDTDLANPDFVSKLENRVRNALNNLVQEGHLRSTTRGSFGFARSQVEKTPRILFEELKSSDEPEFTIPVHSQLTKDVLKALKTLPPAEATTRNIVAEVRAMYFGQVPPTTEPRNQNGSLKLDTRIRSALYHLRQSGEVRDNIDGTFEASQKVKTVITPEAFLSRVRSEIDQATKNDTNSQELEDLRSLVELYFTEDGETPPNLAALWAEAVATLELDNLYRIKDGILFVNAAAATSDTSVRDGAVKALDWWRAIARSAGSGAASRLDGGTDNELSKYQCAGPFGIPTDGMGVQNSTTGVFAGGDVGRPLRKILYEREFIVLGQQGVGKSALLNFLTARYPAPQSNTARNRAAQGRGGRDTETANPGRTRASGAERTPVVTNIEVSSIMGSLPEGAAERLSKEFDWRARFLLHYAETLLEVIDGTEWEPDFGFRERARLRRSVRQLGNTIVGIKHGGKIAKLFRHVTRFVQSVEVPGILGIGLGDGGRNEGGAFQIALALEIAVRKVSDAAGKNLPPVVAVIDRLDHVWSDSESLKRELAGMVLAAMAFSDQYDTSPNRASSNGSASAPLSFKVVLLMRNDVYNVVKREVLGESRVKLSGKTIEVRWNQALLAELLVRRLLHAQERAGLDEALLLFAGSKGATTRAGDASALAQVFGNSKATASLIRDASLVPRNVLVAVNNVIDIAGAKSLANAIEEADPEAELDWLVSEALRRMAENTQEAVIANSFMSTIDLETLLAGLRNSDAISATRQPLRVLADSAGCLLPEADRTDEWRIRAARDLYRAGVFGYEKPSKTGDGKTETVFAFEPDAPFEPPLTLNSNMSVHSSMILALWPDAQ